MDINCKSVVGGWQTQVTATGYCFGPVFNNIADLWTWQTQQDLGNLVPITELKLGDLVRLYDGAFSDAIVKRISNGTVTVERPYMSCENFAYTGGVIAYIGHEDIQLTYGYVRRLRVQAPTII